MRGPEYNETGAKDNVERGVEGVDGPVLVGKENRAARALGRKKKSGNWLPN